MNKSIRQLVKEEMHKQLSGGETVVAEGVVDKIVGWGLRLFGAVNFAVPAAISLSSIGVIAAETSWVTATVFTGGFLIVPALITGLSLYASKLVLDSGDMKDLKLYLKELESSVKARDEFIKNEIIDKKEQPEEKETKAIEREYKKLSKEQTLYAMKIIKLLKKHDIDLEDVDFKNGDASAARKVLVAAATGRLTMIEKELMKVSPELVNVVK